MMAFNRLAKSKKHTVDKSEIEWPVKITNSLAGVSGDGEYKDLVFECLN